MSRRSRHGCVRCQGGVDTDVYGVKMESTRMCTVSRWSRHGCVRCQDGVDTDMYGVKMESTRMCTVSRWSRHGYVRCQDGVDTDAPVATRYNMGKDPGRSGNNTGDLRINTGDAESDTATTQNEYECTRLNVLWFWLIYYNMFFQNGCFHRSTPHSRINYFVDCLFLK